MLGGDEPEAAGAGPEDEGVADAARGGEVGEGAGGSEAGADAEGAVGSGEEDGDAVAGPAADGEEAEEAEAEEEPAAGSDADEEDADEGPARKKKRRPRREDLDDDDYDLIEENTGRRLARRENGASGFRRLQKRAREPAADGEEPAADGEELDGDTARRQIEAELFGGEEEEEDDEGAAGDAPDGAGRHVREAEIGSDDEEDEDEGFIVDEEGNAVKLDEPDEQNGAEVEEAEDIFGTAAELAELLAFTKHRGGTGGDVDAEAEGEEGARRGAAVAMDGGGPDGDDDELDEGDEEEMEGFDVEGDDEEDEDKIERNRLRQAERVARRRAARSAAKQASASQAASKLARLYPPEMLAANFMLPVDERIRALDVPERLQPRAAGRAPPADGELRREAEWIVSRAADGWLRGSADPRAPAPSAAALGALVGPVERSLHCMRVEHLEPPVVCAHRKDESAPLSEGWLWDVLEGDGAWARMQGRKEGLRAQWARDSARLGAVVGEAGRGAFEAALARADDDCTLDDLSDYLSVRQGVALGGGAAAEPAAGGRPVRHGLLVAAQRAGVDILAAQLGLASEQFAANLRDGWATYSIVEPVDTAEGAADVFMAAALEQHGGRPPPGLPSGLPADALAATRELAAHQLATEPEVRAYVRAHMLERALLTVALTEKGEAEIDGAHPHHALRAYRGEPLRALLRAAPTAERPLPPPPLPPAEREAALLRFLRARQAASEGLCVVRVSMPEYGSLDRDELYAEFLRAYCPDGDAPLPEHDPDGACRTSWNMQRYLLLERALVGLLYAQLGRQLEAQLRTDAQRALVRACQRGFDRMLGAARPLRDRELRERRPLLRDAYSARSVLVAACKDPNGPTVLFAKLSTDGELVDFLRAEWLLTSARRNAATGEWRTRSAADRQRKLEELKKLAGFFAGEDSGAPAFCVLGASHIKCRQLREELEHLARALAVRAREGDGAFDAYNECAYPKGRQEFVDGPLGVEKVDRAPLWDARPPVAMTAAEMDAEAPFRVLFAPEAVPALYAGSAMAAKELGERHPLLWRATSLGRMAQDAVVELAHVCGPTGAGLGALRVHPLQGCMPRAALAAALRERAVSWVARIGVRLPWALAHGTQARSLLQYVPGLGPRKGARLFDALSNLALGSHDVAARAELAERGLLGARVYANAAPFFFFTPIGSGGPGLLREAEAELEIEPTLEITRVHPEHYEYANQLCVQAAADDEAAELPEAAQAVRAMIGNREALLQLELTEYARFLRGEQMEGAEAIDEAERRELELQLECIRQALIEPYVDPRPPICERTPELTDAPGELPQLPELLAPDELFELLTGDTRESLTGTILGGTALRAGNRERVPGMWCALENGMQAHLPAHAMSDSLGEMGPEEYPVQPGQTFHCVVLSPEDIDLAKCECVVSCRAGDLARADFRSVAEQRLASARPSGPKILRRRITHPLFQNVQFDKAREILNSGAPGDVLFRPSRKGPDHLTMSWVWAAGTIVHVDVLERDKPSAEQLGRTLVVGFREGHSEGETFEALDEIHARYAAPISDLVSEAMSHRKFAPRKQVEVDALVRKEKEGAPGGIPYRVCVSEKAANCLSLTYVPGKTVRHELIHVKPSGFRMHGLVHASLDELLVWFKRNFSTLQPQPPQRRPPPPMAPPPVSSWPNQQHMGSWEPANTAAANARANAQAASNFLGGLMG